MNSAEQTLRSPSRVDHQWARSNFPTVQSSYSLCQRIEFIIEKLNEEKWLPAKLKQAIRQRCTSVLNVHLKGKLCPATAKMLIEDLAACTFNKDDLVLHSSTLCQIRTLDLELQDSLDFSSNNQIAV